MYAQGRDEEGRDLGRDYEVGERRSISPGIRNRGLTTICSAGAWDSCRMRLEHRGYERVGHAAGSHVEHDRCIAAPSTAFAPDARRPMPGLDGVGATV